ncbi:MAG: hypothetical protein GX871_02935 [Microbacteriaceae bacterium]|nr:hypothetical protein [Microbacteriaceae bacterium]
MSNPRASLVSAAAVPAARPRIWLALFALLAALVLLVSGCSSPDNSAAATGETTKVTVRVNGMLYDTDVIEVPYGNRLEVTFENTSRDVHDLRFANGKASQRLAGGKAEVIDVGVITEDMEGWCTIAGHRQQGMELDVVVTGAPAE